MEMINTGLNSALDAIDLSKLTGIEQVIIESLREPVEKRIIDDVYVGHNHNWGLIASGRFTLGNSAIVVRSMNGKIWYSAIYGIGAPYGANAVFSDSNTKKVLEENKGKISLLINQNDSFLHAASNIYGIIIPGVLMHEIVDPGHFKIALKEVHEFYSKLSKAIGGYNYPEERLVKL